MTTVDGTAPYTRNLSIPCGMDYEVAVSFVDSTTGLAINVTSPRCEVRDEADTSGHLLLSPSTSASGNTATVTFGSAATKALGTRRAYYDLFVTRSDTGQEVKLAVGRADFVGAVTAL